MAEEDAQIDRRVRSVLYLTYDGLCDPIGQSQILPYLVGCARAGHKITVLSFEKAPRLALLGDSVRLLCTAENIRWQPQRFRSKPPFLAKALDLQTMARAAARESRRGYDFVHARSYVPAVVALKLKRRFGIPLLFDMRGFWPDQRREGGRWRYGNLLGAMLYRRWKWHERALISGADHIVALTDAARDEIRTWPAYRGAPVSVIPCCADFDHFQPASQDRRSEARARLGIAEAPVLGYLGSVGTVYLLDQLLRLLEAIRARQPEALLFFIGQENLEPVLREAQRQGIPLAAEQIRAIRAERTEVPYWLGAIDVAGCFITPTYSSKGVSATKLAEYFACGLPVIANGGVGDIEQIMNATGGGHLVRDFSDGSIERAALAFADLMHADGLKIRERARPLLDVPRAVAAYRRIYANLGSAVLAGPK